MLCPLFVTACRVSFFFPQSSCRILNSFMKYKKTDQEHMELKKALTSFAHGSNMEEAHVQVQDRHTTFTLKGQSATLIHTWGRWRPVHISSQQERQVKRVHWYLDQVRPSENLREIRHGQNLGLVLVIVSIWLSLNLVRISVRMVLVSSWVRLILVRMRIRWSLRRFWIKLGLVRIQVRSYLVGWSLQRFSIIMGLVRIRVRSDQVRWSLQRFWVKIGPSEKSGQVRHSDNASEVRPDVNSCEYGPMHNVELAKSRKNAVWKEIIRQIKPHLASCIYQCDLLGQSVRS